MKITHDQKLSLLNQLIKIASADGEHRDEEYDMLHIVSQQLDVDPMEMEMLFTKDHEYSPPASEAQRITIFYHLLIMIWVDGELHPDELTLLEEYSMHLGLSSQAVQSVIKESMLYPNGKIPLENIIKTFQVHHN
jgi:uncharacterized tellurite resistance protein B-like protein